MQNRISRFSFFLVLVGLLAGAGVWFSGGVTRREGAQKTVRLHWFVPDGLRADPSVFRLFEWADKGELPNLRRMMKRGAWGYSIPVFPGHTPVNMAALFTGASPMTNGVADGAMRFEGFPLKMVSRSGFSSSAKKIPPIWFDLEQKGISSTLLSVPGSTPPEISSGITVMGRWGGWGLEFPAVVFQSDSALKYVQGMEKRAFTFGPELTKFVKPGESSKWDLPLPKSFSSAQEYRLENWGQVLWAYAWDSTDDGKASIDRVLFSLDKKSKLAELGVGDWSEWLPLQLAWETKNDYNINSPKSMQWERDLSALKVDTRAKIRVIRLGEKDSFRVRVLYDSLNEFLVQPQDLQKQISEAVGPVVDFVDNYPPQLVYFPEDKKVFLEEAEMSWRSHIALGRYFLSNLFTDAIIHSIYTPNQMHTSRWWMPFLDPASPSFGKVDESERAQLWQEEKAMLKRIDTMIGDALDHAGPESVIVLSSDHGAIPLHREVRLNNLFAREGLLKFRIDPATGESAIDWKNTKAVFLQMNHIYVNPKGLHGAYYPAKGPEYEALLSKVTRLLQELKDADGKAPLHHFLRRSDVHRWKLPGERVGDLVIANSPGYSWVEEVSNDLGVFKESLKGGYKQAVLGEDVQGMWTPFVIVGPGIRPGHRLEKPISHLDQYPTILRAMGQDIPETVEGKVLDEIFNR